MSIYIYIYVLFWQNIMHDLKLKANLVLIGWYKLLIFSLNFFLFPLSLSRDSWRQKTWGPWMLTSSSTASPIAVRSTGRSTSWPDYPRGPPPATLLRYSLPIRATSSGTDESVRKVGDDVRNGRISNKGGWRRCETKGLPGRWTGNVRHRRQPERRAMTSWTNAFAKKVRDNVKNRRIGQ